MKFDLTAAKAYVGGAAAAALATAGPGFVKFIDGVVAAGTGWAVPDGINMALLAGFAWVAAHLAVYITPNKTA